MYTNIFFVNICMCVFDKHFKTAVVECKFITSHELTCAHALSSNKGHESQREREMMKLENCPAQKWQQPVAAQCH